MISMVLVGIILLVGGMLHIWQPSLEWLIRFRNKMQGAKTEITAATIAYNRVIGALLVLGGLLFITVGFITNL